MRLAARVAVVLAAFVSALAADGAESASSAVAVKPYSAKALATIHHLVPGAMVPTMVPAIFETTYAIPQPFQDGSPLKTVGLDIVLSPVPDCDGATVCTNGDVYVQRPPATEDSKLDTERSKIATTKLSDGTPAKYRLGPCGANCAGSFDLQFVKGGLLYTIALKGGTLAQGLLIAEHLKRL